MYLTKEHKADFLSSGGNSIHISKELACLAKRVTVELSHGHTCELICAVDVSFTVEAVCMD